MFLVVLAEGSRMDNKDVQNGAHLQTTSPESEPGPFFYPPSPTRRSDPLRPPKTRLLNSNADSAIVVNNFQLKTNCGPESLTSSASLKDHSQKDKPPSSASSSFRIPTPPNAAQNLFDLDDQDIQSRVESGLSESNLSENGGGSLDSRTSDEKLPSAKNEEKLREFCCFGNLKGVKELVKSGCVDVNCVNSVNGWTPLHWAAKRGDSAIVTLLLNKGGANPNILSAEGELPIDLASSVKVEQILLKSTNAQRPGRIKRPPTPLIIPPDQNSTQKQFTATSSTLNTEINKKAEPIDFSYPYQPVVEKDPVNPHPSQNYTPTLWQSSKNSSTGNLPIFGRRRGSSGSNHVDTPLENDSDSQRSLRFGQVVTSSPGLVAGGQMVYGNGFVSAGNTPKIGETKRHQLMNGGGAGSRGKHHNINNNINNNNSSINSNQYQQHQHLPNAHQSFTLDLQHHPPPQQSYDMTSPNSNSQNWASSNPNGSHSSQNNSHLGSPQGEVSRSYRIVKVRIAGKDPDFVEIDLPLTKLTLRGLIEVACLELFETFPVHVERVRKLPNTRLRRDVEVERLGNYSEIELVLASPTTLSQMHAGHQHQTSHVNNNGNHVNSNGNHVTNNGNLNANHGHISTHNSNSHLNHHHVHQHQVPPPILKDTSTPTSPNGGQSVGGKVASSSSETSASEFQC